jgi:DUF971 family protein
MSEKLIEIHRLPGQRRMRLTWSDGHTAEFPYDYVRGYCPCAACQGHGNFEIEYQPPESPVDLASIMPVGNYGVSFVWTDGHATGIYRFDFLRSICPCDTCSAEREAKGAEPLVSDAQGAQEPT